MLTAGLIDHSAARGSQITLGQFTQADQFISGAKARISPGEKCYVRICQPARWKFKQLAAKTLRVLEADDS